MIESKMHLIVSIKEYTTIINALDVFQSIIEDKPIEPDYLDAIRFHFERDSVSTLAEKICTTK